MCCLISGTEQNLFCLPFSPAYGNQQDKPSAEYNWPPKHSWLGKKAWGWGQTPEEPVGVTGAAAVPQSCACPSDCTGQQEHSCRAKQFSTEQPTSAAQRVLLQTRFSVAPWTKGQLVVGAPQVHL